MKKQLLVLDKEIELLKKDSFVKGIMLIGSVSYGTANKYSDLDLIVLCDKDEFYTKEVDGITVEIHYSKYETLLHKLESNPIEVYKYLYSKIIFDNGEYAKLYNTAKDIYDNYKTSNKERESIAYWLSSTKSKLTCAINCNDLTRISYLVATNTWKLLEGIYAINDKPVPPSSLVFNKHKSLELPIDNWFERLLTEDTLSRADTMIKIIDIICSKL